MTGSHPELVHVDLVEAQAVLVRPGNGPTTLVIGPSPPPQGPSGADGTKLIGLSSLPKRIELIIALERSSLHAVDPLLAQAGATIDEVWLPSTLDPTASYGVASWAQQFEYARSAADGYIRQWRAHVFADYHQLREATGLPPMQRRVGRAEIDRALRTLFVLDQCLASDSVPQRVIDRLVASSRLRYRAGGEVAEVDPTADEVWEVLGPQINALPAEWSQPGGPVKQLRPLLNEIQQEKPDLPLFDEVHKVTADEPSMIAYMTESVHRLANRLLARSEACLRTAEALEDIANAASTLVLMEGRDSLHVFGIAESDQALLQRASLIAPSRHLHSRDMHPFHRRADQRRTDQRR